MQSKTWTMYHLPLLMNHYQLRLAVMNFQKDSHGAGFESQSRLLKKRFD
jgi:hypothetical protein